MIVLLLRWIARLPLRWLHAAGAVVGWCVYRASPVYAARIRENLAASGVCSDALACARLLRTCIAETGKAVTEIPKIWFGSPPEMASLVVCQGWALVEAARAPGKGLIFLTPHLGSFEVAALYAARRLPLTVLYRPPKLRWLEPVMSLGRNAAHPAPATMRGVRMLYKALQRGEAIGLLPDQAPGAGEGAWADFFGRPAYTMTLVGRLQKATGAAVVAAFAERQPRGRGYVIHLERLPDEPLDEAALNRAIEKLVRRCPGQYLWSYNRYKIPAGAPPPPRVAPLETRPSPHEG
jgi:KDO2-lipid IV(A) lauroyltransferase